VVNMLFDRRAGDQIFFAEFRFDAAGRKVLLCTIPLDAARRAGDAGLGVEGKGVLNGQDKIAVAAGRDKSRRVGGFHVLMITQPIGCLPRYPQERTYGNHFASANSWADCSSGPKT
jgi:hypothetical protein